MNFIPKIEFDIGPTIITFELPPEGDFRKQNFVSNSATTQSNNGKEQTQFNFSQNNKDINFTFVPESIKQELDTFMTAFALRGKEFKYFESSDEVEFITVTLTRKRWNPVIMFATNTENEFVYEFNIAMRELLTA